MAANLPWARTILTVLPPQYGISVLPNNALLLCEFAKPTQRNRSLGIVDFMGASESPDSNSLEPGSLD